MTVSLVKESASTKKDASLSVHDCVSGWMSMCWVSGCLAAQEGVWIDKNFGWLDGQVFHSADGRMVGLVGVKVGEWLSGWMRVWVDSEQSVWIVVWVSGRFVGAWVGSQISETKTGNKITKFTWSHQASLPLTPNDDDLQWIPAILEKNRNIRLTKFQNFLEQSKLKQAKVSDAWSFGRGFIVSVLAEIFSVVCVWEDGPIFFFFTNRERLRKTCLTFRIQFRRRSQQF